MAAWALCWLDRRTARFRIGLSRRCWVTLKRKVLAVGGVALGVLAVVLGLRWLLAHLAYEQQLAQCKALRNQLS